MKTTIETPCKTCLVKGICINQCEKRLKLFYDNRIRVEKDHPILKGYICHDYFQQVKSPK